MDSTFQQPLSARASSRVGFLPRLSLIISVLWLALTTRAIALYQAVGKANRAMVLATVVGIASFTGMVFFSSDYSLYGAKICAAVLICDVFYFIVRVVHGKLDPIEQIKKRNMAFVAYMALYAALILGGFCISF